MQKKKNMLSSFFQLLMVSMALKCAVLTILSSCLKENDWNKNDNTIQSCVYWLYTNLGEMISI